VWPVYCPSQGTTKQKTIVELNKDAFAISTHTILLSKWENGAIVKFQSSRKGKRTWQFTFKGGRSPQNDNSVIINALSCSKRTHQCFLHDSWSLQSEGFNRTDSWTNLICYL